MNFENPTRLRIGMHGDFAGKDFRIIGRVVMGVVVAGEDFFWNEFNLETKSGERATLVFDESEGGATWRLFTEFQPDYPLTPADAVLKQVGDVVNLTGEDVRVTWTGSSRVHRVEGLAPKNLKVGDEDNYFNAELRDTMLVVSWTGQAVEFYQGITLTSQAIANAFRTTDVSPTDRRLPLAFDRTARLDGGDSENYLSGSKFIVLALSIGFVFFLLLFFKGCTFSPTYEAAPMKKISAPAAPPLTVGASGVWEEKNLRVTAHAIIEIGETGAVFERHEYELTDDSGLVTLLVCGDQPGTTDWTIFTPLTPSAQPTPQESATQKIGDRVTIADVTVTINELFQSTVRSVDNTAPTGWHPGDVSFGYSARGQNDLLLARWDNSGGKFYRGKKISAKQLSAALLADSHH